MMERVSILLIAFADLRRSWESMCFTRPGTVFVAVFVLVLVSVAYDPRGSGSQK